MSQTTRLGWCAAFALATAISLFAAVAPDTIQGSGGPITIQPIMHAAVQIRYANQVITVDPTGMGGDYNTLPKADIVLVTDIHGDHLDPATIAKASKPNATVVAPSAAAAQIKGATVIANGETKTINGVSIEAVPMYNLQRGPSAGQLFHTKGRGNGYVVNVGGKRLYFAGDTECIPEMKALKNIDAAFIPMNLPYTMPPSEAAECVKAFKPKIAYPYHYMGSDLKQFEDALKGSGVEVRVRDWYAK
ncbi:MAG TPA: MBL fold metallo-hydrolase [Terriglobia bacterium]|nr:MBL fold metallo-hydrolase [Terriglobia bacterium]